MCVHFLFLVAQTSEESAETEKKKKEMSSDGPHATLQRVRDCSNFAKTKVYATKKGFAFAPVYGLTSVMMLSDETIQWFARPLYEYVARHPELSHIVLPLPPESYHVTLRGLEAVIPHVAVESLAQAESAYAATWTRLRPAARGVRVKWEDPMFSAAAVLLVEPICDTLNDVLEEMQQSTASLLGLPAGFIQEYHVSVGYFVTENYDHQRFAQQRILEEAKRLIAARRAELGGNVSEDVGFEAGFLALEGCHVCWYDSMTRFPPLLPP